MRLLTFVLNVLWEEACCIINESSFHSYGPEYVKVFWKSKVFALGNYDTDRHTRVCSEKYSNF